MSTTRPAANVSLPLKNVNSSEIKTKVPWEPYRAATGSSTTNVTSSTAFTYQPLTPPHRQVVEHAKSADPSLAIHLNKDQLVRYKIRTDMEKFNAKRPGHEFSESDFKHLEQQQQETTSRNIIGGGHFSDSISELLVKNSIENTKRNLSTRLAQDLAGSSTASLSTTTNGDQQLNTSKLLPSFVDARFYTDAQFLKLANQLKKSSLEPLQKSSSQKKQSAKSIDNNETVAAVSSHVTEESREQYEARIEYLESQMKGIYEQLQIQTQVNVELKKMLVASVSGEDLEYKLERLINDKQRYEFELTKNRGEIQKLSEQVEQISIQCDLWRSKFSAAKLISEENFAWFVYFF
jgi:hypothetical protein